MDLSNFVDSAKPVVVAFGLKVIGALALYIIARWLIGIVGTIITKSLERQKIEPTVIRYMRCRCPATRATPSRDRRSCSRARSCTPSTSSMRGR